MAERKGLSKKIRFEVFKRDKFTCQYCGKSAPGVILEIDHIKPVAKYGDNEILNLITACKACNRGKRDRELSDDAVVVKRKKQLDELQKQREQIEMMYEWQISLANNAEVAVDKAAELVDYYIWPPYYANPNGKNTLRKHIQEYGYENVLESIRISALRKLPNKKPRVTEEFNAETRRRWADAMRIGSKTEITDPDEKRRWIEYINSYDDDITLEEVSTFLDYIPRVAKSRKIIQGEPYMAELYKIKNYMRIRFGSVDYEVLKLLKAGYAKCKETDVLNRIANKATSFDDWKEIMGELING